MKGLKGKVAIVTGGSTLIGQQVVRAFHDEGVKVTVADVDEKGGEAFASELGEGVQFIKTDQTVQIALLHLLNGVQLETWQREHLQNLWQDQYGISPHLDLHPLNSNLQQMDQT